MLPTFSPLPEIRSTTNKTVIHKASSSSSVTSANTATNAATNTATAITATATSVSSNSSSSGNDDNAVTTIERNIESIKSTSSSTSVISVPNAPSTTETKDMSAPTEAKADEKQEDVLSAAFVSDLNIPDGTHIVPNKIFIKVRQINEIYKNYQELLD